MSPTFGNIRQVVQARNLSAVTLLISSWINLLLYACEALLYVHLVFSPKPKITRRTTVFISLALFVDTIGSIAICCSTVAAFDSVLLTWSVNEAELSVHWSTLVTVVTTYSASVLEQSYFLRRYWSISHNHFVTTILAIFVFANAVSAIVIAIFFQLNPVSGSTLELEEDTPLASAALMATTDISLAIVTIWKLKSVRTSRNTVNVLLHRFCLYIGAYGCVTAVATSMLFGCWLIDLNAYTFIFHILGRIYSLTALISLYIAHEWRTEMAKEPTATQSPRTHMSSSNPCKVTGISATEPVIQSLTQPQKSLRSIPAPTFLEHE
ncbi:hypothetical protein FB446DRAFT_125394 [Lentinula raphanica]|nr:hypothetical protein FB446DRAFT_125394 [Lentinula raphanica]